MRVLITGTTGFIGGALLRAAPADWVLNSGDAFDLVIHCGAFVNPGRSRLEPSRDVASLGFLADLLEQRRTSRFIFLSSGAVYEGLTGPVSPYTRPEPLHPYAVCKLAAERLLKHARREEIIEEYVTLRLFGAYGPGEPANKLPTRLLQAPAGEPFAIAGNGLNLVDYLYIDDVVQRILAVATSDLHDITLDIAGNAPLSVKAFAQEVRPDLEFRFSGRASEPITFWSCCHRYQDYFGEPTTTPLGEGIAKLKASLT